MTDASAEQCTSLDDFCGGRNVGKKFSQSDFSSVDDPFAHESYNPLPDLSDPNKVFNPVNLASLLVQEFWKTPSALTSFAHASLGLTTCTIPESASNSLWPVPLPRRWTVASRLSPRRRRRKQYYHVRQQLLEIVVICLNWETLGFPCRPPPEAMRGGFISTAQHGILEHLETCLDHFLHMSPFTADDLGRSAEKFESVITNLKELPKCKLRLQDLEICLHELHSFLDPYSSHFKAKTDDDHSPEHQCDFSDMGRSQAVSVGSSKAVVSDRVKWENPPSFRAEDFLSGMVRAAYDDPEVMRKPPDEWTSVKPGRMHCSKEEFLKLVSRWDSLGACRLVPFTDQDPEELVGLFCVAKDSSFDRLIINPRVINSRMDTISDATKELAPGSMLGLLHLGPNDVFRFSADDLSDFYYTFKVGEKRALRNTFKLPLQSSDVCHLTCFDPKHHQGKTLLVCLSTLAMGDNLAVEIAQSAHKAVLSELCGSMLVSETLRYRCPIPRSDFIELLAIDDHVGIQKLSRESLKDNPCLRDSIVFGNAEHAYKAVGLIQHPKKRKRNLTQGTILGADFDGVAGRVMAPRSRVLLLSIITLAIAHQGTCTPKLLSILLGSWIHVLLFRRVMFALMDRLFHEGSDLPPDQIFCLSRRARTELQLLGSLGSLAQADLRAQHSSKIYCTDASPSGGAVIWAPVTPAVTAEFWRYSEQRGFHTRLESPVSELLREHGLPSETSEQFISKQPEIINNPEQIPRVLAEGIVYDCIEIFRGVGNWSLAHSSQQLRVHPGIENSGRTIRVADMASRAVFHELRSLALRRVIRDWHCGTPCLSFGTLRRPQVRSKLFPAGFNMQDPFTAYHNMLARRSAFILTLALMAGAFVSVEQPASSRMFLLHCFKVMLSLGCVISHFAFCNFGSAFRKSSKWLHNKPWLIGLEGPCNCPNKGKHFIIQGGFTRETLPIFDSMCRPSAQAVFGRRPNIGESVASFSGSYPKRLMACMASGSSKAKQGLVDKIPLECRLRSFKEVGLDFTDGFISYPTDPVYPMRLGHEDPEWLDEICDFLPFRESFRYRFKKSGHINVNESRVYKSLIKSVAKAEPGHRFVALLDSRVTIGAASKGRSSSASLSRILQGTVGFILGGNLYPGLLHCSSGRNRSDGPSRGKELAGPTKEPPQWFLDLAKGDTRAFDCIVSSSRIPKLAARWLRFLLLLGGDIERNPGPRARGPLDLKIGFVPATSDRMEKCFDGLRRWCMEVGELDWEAIHRDPKALAWALRAYGLHLFEEGHPRYLFTYAITAAQEYLPEARAHLSVAWQINKKWQIHEPGECRAVLPSLVIRAACCLACIWNWKAWLGVVLLGFSAMLHPAEMMALVRRDLIFPRDVHFDSPSLFIRVRDPKTARFARRQHGRVDDTSVIQICEALFFNLALDEKIFPGSITSFRKQWNSIMKRLGVPCTQAAKGATPGVLRGSGATYLYSCSEDINWVAWRGRWSRVRTLEYYLQEVGAQMLIHELDPLSRARVTSLADAAWPVLFSTLLAAQNVKSEVKA